MTGDLATMTECNCSVCTKKGLLHLIVAREKFELISGAAVLEIYRFNTGTARHSFCRVCGVQPFYTPRSDPRQDRRQCALP
ncbi:MAG TPA: GFA family protein [Stellaceae bacterium]|nr:GFA family protein [Stellaceae bacterium]